MERLFSLSQQLEEKNIQVILIQVDEAHSNAWPLPLDTLLNVGRVEPQKTFSDRVARARHFINKYSPPYKVYIDTWPNTFAEKFRAWPDKYCLVDDKLTIVAKSEYHHDEVKEATVKEDCTVVLERLLNVL
jgi:hypothetical protein